MGIGLNRSQRVTLAATLAIAALLPSARAHAATPPLGSPRRPVVIKSPKAIGTLDAANPLLQFKGRNHNHTPLPLVNVPIAIVCIVGCKQFTFNAATDTPFLVSLRDTHAVAEQRLGPLRLRPRQHAGRGGQWHRRRRSGHRGRHAATRALLDRRHVHVLLRSRGRLHRRSAGHARRHLAAGAADVRHHRVGSHRVLQPAAARRGPCVRPPRGRPASGRVHTARLSAAVHGADLDLVLHRRRTDLALPALHQQRAQHRRRCARREHPVGDRRRRAGERLRSRTVSDDAIGAHHDRCRRDEAIRAMRVPPGARGTSTTRTSSASRCTR